MQTFKSIVLAVLSCLGFVANSQEQTLYATLPILPIGEDYAKYYDSNPAWHSCGPFFAAIDVTEGEVVFFQYQTYVSTFEPPRIFALTKKMEIISDVDQLKPVVLVDINYKPLGIAMNTVDDIVAKPCLKEARRK